jgi:hypothetical protein
VTKHPRARSKWTLTGTVSADDCRAEMANASMASDDTKTSISFV